MSLVQKNVLVINASTPANSVAELIAMARSQPGKMSFGSAGSGTSQHLSGELSRTMTEVDIVHVPYKGSAAAMTELLGGQITMMFTTSRHRFRTSGRGSCAPWGSRRPSLPARSLTFVRWPRRACRTLI